jgi:hypothetical protein
MWPVPFLPVPDESSFSKGVSQELRILHGW